ncbi:radical SAM protein [Pectinatus frisingensis]|uniref:radical SAM protein n=1 Tax=Pectinatus frisingensis TaxID=865 RepID=UPI0018C569C7|nr:radical SAM protein [Pectinatus frisingensis]
MANIGLIDIDSHSGFPNLALMKLSAWHKSQGDKVFLLKADDVLLGNSLFTHYDKIYGACVFDWNKNTALKLQTLGVIVHGTGIDLRYNLPTKIENIYPDYSLYDITDTAYGFLSRGCPRHCKFCIVGDKEGLKSYKVSDLKDFWRGQKNIIILDPNLLACTDHLDLLNQLANSKAWININQGFDARLLNDKNIQAINNLKVKMIHFAWDNYEDKVVPEKLRLFKEKTKFNKSKMRVYILTNFNTTIQQDLERIYTLRSMEYDPYIMIYDKQHAPKQIKRMQRWVNNIFIWRKCERFEDYDHKVG